MKLVFKQDLIPKSFHQHVVINESESEILSTKPESQFTHLTCKAHPIHLFAPNLIQAFPLWTPARVHQLIALYY